MNPSFTISTDQKVKFTYTNWRGETAERRAIFKKLFFGSNDFHKEPQWLVEGYDLDKGAYRTYSLRDITCIEILKENAQEQDIKRVYALRAEISMRIRAAGDNASPDDLAARDKLDHILDEYEMANGGQDTIDAIRKKAAVLRSLADDVWDLVNLVNDKKA